MSEFNKLKSQIYDWNETCDENLILSIHNFSERILNDVS